MVIESWFSSFWRSSRKGLVETDKAVIGILTFEVATLMSKVVKLWNCLSDKEFSRTKEEISNLTGIRKLISEDNNYLIELVLNEIIENLGYLARSTAILGRRCTGPIFHRFEQFVNDPVGNDFQWIGWEYRWKKMERKVKKLDRFIAVTTQLAQELDVLAELEQTLRRMRVNLELDNVKLLEFQQKVMWQRQEVANMREMSPWNKTYDYIVRLLMRSIFTLVERIKCVFGINELTTSDEIRDIKQASVVSLPRSHSFSASMQPSLHPLENSPYGFYSGPLKKSVPKPALLVEKSRFSNKQQLHYHSFTLCGKNVQSKTNPFAPIGPFKGCMEDGNTSPVLNSSHPTIGTGSMRFIGSRIKIIDKVENGFMGNSISSFFTNKGRLSNAPPLTLGDSALALHYSNVIILIEKLASSPHFIGHDARGDLYDMLPTRIRTRLRARLKLYAKTAPSSVYDATLAAEWNLVIIRTLEWLAPLAHNMVRWSSERNVEKQHEVGWSHVLLVHTLYYANQEKTEAAITDLLVGLNYVCKINGELHKKDLSCPVNCRAYHNYFCKQEGISFDV